MGGVWKQCSGFVQDYLVGGENDIHGAMPPRGVCGGIRALTLLLVTSGVHKAPTLCV